MTGRLRTQKKFSAEIVRKQEKLYACMIGLRTVQNTITLTLQITINYTQYIDNIHNKYTKCADYTYT